MSNEDIALWMLIVIGLLLYFVTNYLIKKQNQE